MNNEEYPLQQEELVAELTLGYALDELNEQELHTYYDLLRAEGDAGQEAATVAWRVLDTTVDLRALQSEQFIDTINHRLTHASQGQDPSSFINAVLGSLGLRQSRLESVRLPSVQSRSWKTPAAIVALIMVIVLAAIVIRNPTPPQSFVEVTQAHGISTSNGEALKDQTRLDDGVIVVRANSQLDLQWSHGHQARIVGPATFSCKEHGLALLSGRVRIRNSGLFTLGFGQGQVELNNQAEIHTYVHENYWAIGCSRGTCTISQPSATYDKQIVHTNEFICEQGIFPWISIQSKAQTFVLPDIDPGCPWLMSAFLTGSTQSGPHCQLMSNEQTSLLTLTEHGQLHVPEANEKLTLLKGPPRQDRTLNIHFDGQAIRSSIDSFTIEWKTQLKPHSLQGSTAQVDFASGLFPITD